jgi:uncharacterized protein (DUF934 family)
MRKIVRRREVVADDWLYEGEPGSDVAGARVVRPLAAILAEVKAGRELPAGSAVRLTPTDEPELLAPIADRLALVVVDFPKYGDGRGFTQGRLLRQRYRYQGELRATGALKRDFLFFLARCGFDAFELLPSEDLAAAVAAFDSFSVAYQDGTDGITHVRRREPVAGGGQHQ